MGYLSCKADSSISISHSSNNKTPKHPHEKPIKIQEFSYSDLEAATNNFSPQNLLGRGSHGFVYEAILKNGHHVAVKRPSTGNNSKPCLRPVADTNEVENEINVLSKINSPTLVNLLGFTNDPQHRLLVVEFMSNGTLYDILHKSCRPPSWGRRIKLALQTAKAIETLHSLSPPVIHRDIKSANVLIDGNFNARLGDFGLALRCHVDDHCRLRSTPPAGTMGYLDPGYVTPDNLSTKIDVFSFGILLLEIISGRKAIDVQHSPPSILDWAVPLIRRDKHMFVYDTRIEPPKEPLIRRQLAVIAAKCVRSCRERRPTMSEVVKSLSELSKFVPLHSWNGFNNPCMIVENVGCPVERTQLSVRPQNGEQGDLDAAFSRPLRNSRRVYSDLGYRNNLMDLMAGTNGISGSGSQGEDSGGHLKSKSKSERSSTRLLSKRISSRRHTSSHAGGDEQDSVFDMIQNQSWVNADRKIK